MQWPRPQPASAEGQRMSPTLTISWILECIALQMKLSCVDQNERPQECRGESIPSFMTMQYTLKWHCLKGDLPCKGWRRQHNYTKNRHTARAKYKSLQKSPAPRQGLSPAKFEGTSMPSLRTADHLIQQTDLEKKISSKGKGLSPGDDQRPEHALTKYSASLLARKWTREYALMICIRPEPQRWPRDPSMSSPEPKVLQLCSLWVRSYSLSKQHNARISSFKRRMTEHNTFGTKWAARDEALCPNTVKTMSIEAMKTVKISEKYLTCVLAD